jgi:hypothetical protein
MKAIRSGDAAWALREIAGPGAAFDHLRATEASGTGSDPDAVWSGPTDVRFPHRSVTTIDELVANVSATPRAVSLRVAGVEPDGDVVIEAVTAWVAGPPVVATMLGLDAPPAVGRFRVAATLLAEIETVAAPLRRAAELAAEIALLAEG